LLRRRRRLRAGAGPDRSGQRCLAGRNQGAPVSLTITANPSLKSYNSFGVAARAAHFAEARDEAEVREALALAARNGWALRPIGGGSNLLLTGDQDALVLRMALMGKRVLSDDGETVVVEAEAGEPWHPF